MERRVVPARLLAALAATLLVLIPAVCVTAAFTLGVFSAWAAGWVVLPLSAKPMVYLTALPYMGCESSRSWWGNSVTISPAITVAAGAFCLMPFAFVCLPRTLRRAKVRAAHLARIAVSAPLGLVTLLCLRLILCGSCFVRDGVLTRARGVVLRNLQHWSE